MQTLSGRLRSGVHPLAAALLVNLFCLAFTAQAGELPAARDLRSEAREAAARGQPLVLLVSLPDCAYCDQVRDSELLPRMKTGLLAWQIEMGSRATLIDFDGQPITQAALAQRLKARIAPTVVFLNARGDEVAEPLVGAGLPDFYGAYFEQRLGDARPRLLQP